MLPFISCETVLLEEIFQDVIFIPSISIFPSTIIPFSPTIFRYCILSSAFEEFISKVISSAISKVAFRGYSLFDRTLCKHLLLLRLQSEDAAVHMILALLKAKEE